MESTENEGGNALLKTQLTRRTAITAAAWSAPVVAMAAATPAVAASGTFDPLANLEVGALGGAEGRYQTGHNYTGGGVSDTDFRRAFYVKNTSTDGASFTGSLKIDFKFPRMWNQAGVGGNADAFNNWGTVDLGGTGGGSIGSADAWQVGAAATSYTQNTGYYAWTAVWLRNDPASVTLRGVSLPAGATIWFALNVAIPFSWIGDPGVYINPGQPNRIYWRSDVKITATTTGGTNLGTYTTPVGTWGDGIWYFNGGGPFAYLGGHGLYPNYGTS